MNNKVWIELLVNDFTLWKFTITKKENLEKLKEFMKELYEEEL